MQSNQRETMIFEVIATTADPDDKLRTRIVSTVMGEQAAIAAVDRLSQTSGDTKYEYQKLPDQ